MTALRAACNTAISASRRFAGRLYRPYRKWRRIRRGVKEFGVDSLLRDPANRPYLDEIRSYWREHFGRPVHPVWHMAFAKIAGTTDVRLIPLHEWLEEILPFLNELHLRPAYRDKNLSDVFLNYPQPPQTIVKRMHGRYYEGNNTPMSFATAEQRLTTGEKDLIVKSSQTDDGCGIRKLVAKGPKLLLNDRPSTLIDLETLYGRNFLVQERIVQHPLMAQVHPSSLNTVRMVTFRWKNEIRVLLALARFGSEGRLTDNAATGGLFCNIDERGRLDASAIGKTGLLYERHPTTGYSFANRISIPNYDSVCDLVLDLHGRIYHFDFVSWDIAIGIEGDPVFLEMNFRGAIEWYQFASRRPLFGDLTEEVLEAVRDSR